jgi:hypothetical protein
MKTNLPYGAVGPISNVSRVIIAVEIMSFASVVGNKSQSISIIVVIVLNFTKLKMLKLREFREF